MADDSMPDARVLAFDPVRFFLGKTTASGIFEDRRGRVRRQMTIDMVGTPTHDGLKLDEHFRYDDGATETRTWHLTRVENDRFIGATADCVGTAQGTSHARSSIMIYQFRLTLPKSGRSIVVRFDDRLHQLDEATVINRATVSKWGIKLGELFLVLRKQD